MKSLATWFRIRRLIIVIPFQALYLSNKLDLPFLHEKVFFLNVESFPLLSFIYKSHQNGMPVIPLHLKIRTDALTANMEMPLISYPCSKAGLG